MLKEKKNIKSKLVHKYRWMLVDDDSLEAKFSIRINILNVLLIFSILTTILFVSAYLVLKYSPLKTYFIEETSFDIVQSQREILKLNEQIMAIEDSLNKNTLFLEHLTKVVTGDLKAAEVDSLMSTNVPVLIDESKLRASAEDSIFRAQIAQEELLALSNNNVSVQASNMLYPPVRGIITARFSLTENHLATDIAAPIGESVKAIDDGIVIFSDWNPNTGNSIIIQHKNDLMSMYKHCSKVFKEVGNEVKKGDVIAQVGNTGELTTGPHLHFELWVQGLAVDPEEYIEF